MEDGPGRTANEASRPRRGAAGCTEPAAANANQQNGEGVVEVPTRESLAGPGRPTLAARTMERRNSVPPGCYQRYMPMEVLKMPIPRKAKEKRALFQHVSTESREFEDIKTVLNSSYLDANSSSCFTYSKPRLIDSEQLEKEFVEKRKEMKSDGRTEKELEENYCFLLTPSPKLTWLCEKGLIVGHSRITILGNPTKGVYLSRYSDLIQMEPLMPGATGEIVIFKVLKGKVKSIYENMKNLMDPTPRFDSHISKNSSKVTALGSYRAFELTQQYFYEYAFDELRQRPRQVCPYAVVSFQFKGKDSILPSTPLPAIRSNSQLGEREKGCSQFTVWTGDLVKGGRVLFQVSLLSSSPPLLPHKLPEKLEIKWVMKLDHVTDLLPSKIFSYKLYDSSQEVVSSGFYCNLLEVADKSRSTTSVTKLLQELEVNRVVLVFPLSDSGFLFLLPSGQMAPPTERLSSWKSCLQALFVFPESRDVAKYGAKGGAAASQPVMPQMSQFIPALHHSLIKVRANPPPELSAGVERQAREYLVGLKDGKVPQYSMVDYDSRLSEQGRFSHQRANVDGYLRAYLYNPAFYLLSVARARQLVETHCRPEEALDGRQTSASAGQREVAHSVRERQANSQEVQQLIDLVLTCKRNAENEVNREEAGRGAAAMPLGRKRRLEQVKAERAIKYLRASQDYGKITHIPGNQAPSASGSLTSLLSSLGLKDMHLKDDGSEPATRLYRLLAGLKQAARGAASQSLGQLQAEVLKEPSPFDGLATKMGLPTNCDIDLRKQEDLEEQTAGSISSLEGFSPGSHGGDLNHHGGAAGRAGAGGWSGRREGGYGEDEEDWPVSWVLIPITGLSSERYTSRELQVVPQDPRFQHLDDVPTATRTSPAPFPEPSSPPSPSPCPSPCPSPYSSPSQCPSPEPSPPPSPSQCPSPEETSPTPSPPLCPSSPPRPRTPPLQHSTFTCRNQSMEPNQPSLARSHIGANEEHLYPAPSRELEGAQAPSKSIDKESYWSKQPEGPLSSAPPALERTNVSPNPVERTLLGREEHQAPTGGNREPLAKKQPAVSLCSTSLSSSSFSTSSSSSSHHIDAIVDKHQGNLSTEIQLILQRESIHLRLPQSPHSTSRGDTQSSPTHNLVSQFSQYVSFYNPRPPVHEYVSSLQDGIDSLLMELHDGWLSRVRPPDPSDPSEPSEPSDRSDTDNLLASKVEAFVSSIREGKDGEASRSPPTHTTGPWRPRPHEDGSPAPQSAPPVPPSLLASACDTGGNSHHPGASPPAAALSSLIRQIQPEVFSKLVEIVQDVKRNSVQFYVHAAEPADSVYEEIKEHLLKQGNVNQSPMAFLQQEHAESRLLVIIKNKDIAAHIHKIPGLVSLKRHPNVVFVGIDTLDDIMNNSYHELFVSGGCIVSHDFVLNPDCVTPDRLTDLLVLLEQLSSPGSVWKLKIHCKTHKRLKEQSRFRQDAAVLLDILSVYQKRQVVELLPYHYCDMNSHQSPDLKCVMTLQAQCTQYRHMIVLTDRKFEDFPDYSSEGIVVACLEEVLHDPSYLVGYQSNTRNQAVADDGLPPKDHIHPHLSHEHHQHISRPPQPGHSPLSHLPEQLVPDASCIDGPPLPTTSKQLEELQKAIFHFRAERLAQQQQRQQQQQQQQQQQHWLSPQGSRHPEQGAPAEPLHLHPEKKAVAATLDLIHSTLQLEVEEEDRARKGLEPREQRNDAAERMSAGSPSARPTGQNNATEPSHSAKSTAGRREETDCPVEGDRARSTPLIQEQQKERAPLTSSSVPPTGSELTGSSATQRERAAPPHPAPPHPAPPHLLHAQHLQRLAPHRLQPPAHRLLAPPLPHGHAFLPGAMLVPSSALQGGGLLGARPVLSGGLSPAGAALVWGFQPGGLGLLAGYNNPAGQGSARHRGGPQGRSFTGM